VKLKKNPNEFFTGLFLYILLFLGFSPITGIFMVVSAVSTEYRLSNQLNRIDRNILRSLQREGRISYAALAREVGLTTTPCIERVKL
jgi:hypothetical protein